MAELEDKTTLEKHAKKPDKRPAICSNRKPDQTNFTKRINKTNNLSKLMREIQNQK